MPSNRRRTSGQPVARRRRPSAQEWEQHKDFIAHLYTNEGKQLKEVRQIMKDLYQFEAGESTYKKHLSKWNIFKNTRRSTTNGETSTPQPIDDSIQGDEQH
ncbi:unnamed protein product [Clonostachys rhizophaga]|uniref:Clr5 domain-containing protein n=1 Tax=Clonostachys rhizophaga TaxID=160324 RepID=A0A9N9VJH4_9HYPO|nr:unnamed protein product [Clonostachys rhizophaga]